MEYLSNIKHKTLKKQSTEFYNIIIEHFVDKNESPQSIAKYYYNNENKNLFGIINFKNGETYGVSVSYAIKK